MLRIARAKSQRDDVVREIQASAGVGNVECSSDALINIDDITHVHRRAGLGAGKFNAATVGGRSRVDPDVDTSPAGPHGTEVVRCHMRPIPHQNAQGGARHTAGASAIEVNATPISGA